MPRLRTVSTHEPGWKRVKHGRGHRYFDVDGTTPSRPRSRPGQGPGHPAAWSDVWISPYANADLQAVGTDDAGRRQYLYHPAWRQKRDELKFDRVLEMAVKLPGVRKRLRDDLVTDGGRERTAGGRRGAAGRPRLLPARRPQLHRAERQLRADHAGAPSRQPQRHRLCVHVRRQVRGRPRDPLGDPELCQVVDRMMRRRAPEAGCSAPRRAGAGSCCSPRA